MVRNLRITATGSLQELTDGLIGALQTGRLHDPQAGTMVDLQSEPTLVHPGSKSWHLKQIPGLGGPGILYEVDT